MEDFTYSGYWYLPNSNEKLSGTLVYSAREGLSLQLEGVFSSSELFYPLVLGVLKSGVAVSLVNCSEHHTQINPLGLNAVFEIELAFLGVHFESIDQASFRIFEFDIDYLYFWLNKQNIVIDWKKNEQGEYTAFDFTYRAQEPIRAELADGVLFFSSQLVVNRPSPPRQAHGISFIPSGKMRLELAEHMSFEGAFSRFIIPLQNLLTLATGHANTFDSFYVESDSALDKRMTKFNDARIEVVFSSNHYATLVQEAIIPTPPLFFLSDIEARLSDIIQKWLQAYEELDSVCNLYFSLQYNPNLYLEQHFAGIAQALESYHRRRMPNSVLSEDEFEKRKVGILNAIAKIDKKWKDWIKPRLRYANEPYLRMRIEQLFTRVENIITPLIVDKHRFFDDFTNTRNYNTHFDLSLKDKALHGYALRNLTDVLTVMMQAFFLIELGLDDEQVLELLRKTPLYVKLLKEKQRGSETDSPPEMS